MTQPLPDELVEMVLANLVDFQWTEETQGQILALAKDDPEWIPIFIEIIRKKTLLRDRQCIIRDPAFRARLNTLWALREQEREWERFLANLESEFEPEPAGSESNPLDITDDSDDFGSESNPVDLTDDSDDSGDQCSPTLTPKENLRHIAKMAVAKMESDKVSDANRSAFGALEGERIRRALAMPQQLFLPSISEWMPEPDSADWAAIGFDN